MYLLPVILIPTFYVVIPSAIYWCRCRCCPQFIPVPAADCGYAATQTTMPPMYYYIIYTYQAERSTFYYYLRPPSRCRIPLKTGHNRYATGLAHATYELYTTCQRCMKADTDGRPTAGGARHQTRLPLRVSWCCGLYLPAAPYYAMRGHLLSLPPPSPT